MFMSIAHEAADAPTARRRETRSRLLDAATAVFAEEGLQSASVETICNRAGYTRGAFYSNFESKEQLFLELFERELRRKSDHLKSQAVPLIPALRDHGVALSQAEGARYIAEFFVPEDDAITWCLLETELFLLAVREPELGSSFIDFVEGFYRDISEAVEHLINATGRRFTIPLERVLPLMTSIYEGVVRDAALGRIAPERAMYEIGDRLAEILFALTEPAATEIGP